MSLIGSPTPAPGQMSALQAVNAQQAAAGARDRDKARKAEQRRALEDHVDLRVEELETHTAVRSIPRHTSEQEREEREGQGPSGDPPRDHIDLKA